MPSAEEIRRHIRAQLGDQQVLVRSLLALREQLQGSLFERYGVCGKPNCACRLGRRHGPYYVLSSRSGAPLPNNTLNTPVTTAPVKSVPES